MDEDSQLKMVPPAVSPVGVPSAQPPAIATATATAPAAKPKTIPRVGVQGHIDGIGPDGWLDGWAADLAPPHRPVEIRVLDGERLLGIGSADRPRPDVKSAGFGNGFSGFSVAMPDDVFDGKAHKIRIVARPASGPPKLIGSIDSVLTPPTGPNRPRDRASSATAPAAATTGRTIQTLRGNFAEEALTAALGRIDELERSHRAMGVQRDALQAQLRTLGERFGNDLNALAGTPLANEAGNYLGAIVRSLSLTRRRDLWLGELSRRGLAGNIFGTMPHDGAPGPLSVLVWGSGGIGDLLYLGTIVRELFLMLGGCQLFVLHENPAVHEVFAANPYVSGTMFLEGRNLPDFVHTVHTLDVFDLVAEVRYCVTYTTPPLSRAPRPFVNAASYRAAEWQRYVRYQWPHLNNLFGNEVMARGLSKLGLVGLTSMLPIHASSEVDFFIPDWFPDLIPELSGVAFATIHHGSDKKMASAGGVQTKNLPTATWNQIAAHLSAAGLKVVQLGEAHETLVEGVDVDMRGKTQLIETAFVLKMASVHVDTEGGLVHLARAMNTRSVVAFGPTPVGFFGYPQNDNIAPPLCGNCWWTSNRWATQCPRELSEPECMAAHAPRVLAQRAARLVGAERRVSVADVRAVPTSDVVATLRAAIKGFAAADTRGAVVLGREADMQLIIDLERPAGETIFFVPAEAFGKTHAAFGHARLVLPYSGGAISCNSGSLDWAVAVGCNPNLSSFVPTALEMARCVRPGGKLLVNLLPGTAPNTEDLRWTFDLAQSRQIGNKIRMTWPAEIGGFGDDAVVAVTSSLLIELAEPVPVPEAKQVATPTVAAAAVAIALAADAADLGLDVAAHAGAATGMEAANDETPALPTSGLAVPPPADADMTALSPAGDFDGPTLATFPVEAALPQPTVAPAAAGPARANKASTSARSKPPGSGNA